MTEDLDRFEEVDLDVDPGESPERMLLETNGSPIYFHAEKQQIAIMEEDGDDAS